MVGGFIAECHLIAMCACSRGARAANNRATSTPAMLHPFQFYTCNIAMPNKPGPGPSTIGGHSRECRAEMTSEWFLGMLVCV